MLNALRRIRYFRTGGVKPEDRLPPNYPTDSELAEFMVRLIQSNQSEINYIFDSSPRSLGDSQRESIIETIQAKEGSKIVDIGSGKGTIPFQADSTGSYGSNIAIECDGKRVRIIKRRRKHEELNGDVEIIYDNFFNVDIPPLDADVITADITYEGVQKIVPKLNEVKDGTIVVTAGSMGIIDRDIKTWGYPVTAVLVTECSRIDNKSRYDIKGQINFYKKGKKNNEHLYFSVLIPQPFVVPEK